MAFYFTRIEPDPALARGYLFLLDAIRDYTARGERAKAIVCREILAVMWAEYDRLGVRSAAKADEFIRARIRQTQVRPDASGRLRQSVKSRPLPSTFPGGAVGIADIEELDKGTINPSAPTKGAYWRAQEYGTTAHVGRRVPGFFGTGPGNASSPASAAEFRVHPYFEAVLNQRGTPAMVIKRPLQARHFIRDGAAETAVWHAAQETAILDQAVSRLRVL